MLLKIILSILAIISAFPAVSAADIARADSCDSQFPGDVNSDGFINMDDVDYLILCLQSGYIPPVMANADVNGDCCVGAGDVYYLQAYLIDAGPAPVECTCVDPPACSDTCDSHLCGDVNADQSLNLGDWVYLVNYLFSGGPPPVYQADGDFNSDCQINVLDAIDFICTYPWETKNWNWLCECNCRWPSNTENRHCLPGDANGDKEINVGDPIYLIAYIFTTGQSPVPFMLLSGDANGDMKCDVGDAVYLINYIFHLGPPPIFYGNWLYIAGQICLDPDGNHYEP